MTGTDQVVHHRYEPRGAALALFKCRDPEVLVSGPAGTGKAQPLDATVWTPAGPRPMGDLGIGDQVLTPHGRAATVTAIPFRGPAPIYQVTFSDGSSTRCTDGHLWHVSWRDSSDRPHQAGLPLAELLRRGLHKRHGTRPRYEIPLAQPVEFVPRPVPVPAYTLGVLLGDGYLRPGEISFTTADSEMADRVAAEVAPRYRLSVSAKADNAAACYRIVPADGAKPRRPSRAKAGYVSRTSSGKHMARVRLPDQPTGARYIGSFDTPEQAQAAIDAQAHTAFSEVELGGDSIHHDLDRLGLRNARSATKFVPQQYLLNSAVVRWEVLRGLMDTDGYAERTTISFCSVSRRQAEDVRWLVQSLGGTARISIKPMDSGESAYQVWIRLPDPAQAFHLSRKQARTGPRQTPVRRWITKAVRLEDAPAQCITVDTPDGLYLTDDFVVTHNSRGCLEKLDQLALRNPGMKGLIVRKTLASLGATALETWRKHVATEALATGLVRYYGGSRAEPAQYRYANGSALHIGGMDKATKIMSSDYDVVYVAEAIELTEADWEALTTRLRNGVISFQQLIADTNPDQDTHWLKKRCDAGTTTLLESRHDDNPVLVDADGRVTELGATYLAKLDALTGVRHARLRRGLWVAAEGTIYEDYWDPAVHLVDRFWPPADWARLWAVDFGYSHPFVWQDWAEDPDGRLFLHREIHMTGRLVEDHARGILRAVTRRAKGASSGDLTDDIADDIDRGLRVWTEPEPSAVICDHDAEGRATLEKYLGRGTVPAHKAVLEGIQAVQARFRAAGDGKPRLFVMRDSLVERDQTLVDAAKPLCLADELGGYVWDTGAGRKAKEQPLKQDDDSVDTMRYVVAHRDLGGSPNVRWL